MSTRPCNDCIHCDAPFGSEPCSSCREFGMPIRWAGFVSWRDELARLRAELSARDSARPPLTDEQIAAAVRPLYSDNVCAEFALHMDIETARAIERVCAEAWGIVLAVD